MAFLADTDAVAPRLAIAHDVVQVPLAGVDDDGAGLFVAIVGNRLRQEAIDLAGGGGFDPRRGKQQRWRTWRRALAQRTRLRAPAARTACGLVR
jgi:hypothetical protein